MMELIDQIDKDSARKFL